MKGFVLSFLVFAWAVAVHAQGTVNFVNVFPNFANPVVKAPVYTSDGVTLLSGSQFMAELLGGASADSLVSIATTGFLTGAGAGYYNGGAQQIPGVGGGNIAWVEVRVWNASSGSSFLQAQASGLPNSWWQSSVFTVIPGGEGAPPFAPAALTGLGTSPVYLNSVPEPSALTFLSLGGILVLRRCLTSRGNE